MSRSTVDGRAMLDACTLLNIQDRDLARVLDVPMLAVMGWKSEQRITRRKAPAFAALLEATFVKSMVDFTRKQTGVALPPDLQAHLRFVSEQIERATLPIKQDSQLGPRYKRIVTRMLEALDRADHVGRITPAGRGFGG